MEKAARLRLVWAQANLRMVRPKTGFNGFFCIRPVWVGLNWIEDFNGLSNIGLVRSEFRFNIFSSKQLRTVFPELMS